MLRLIIDDGCSNLSMCDLQFNGYQLAVDNDGWMIRNGQTNHRFLAVISY